jgi:hypothetical protein
LTPLHERGQILVVKDGPRAGVVEDIPDVLRSQADVDGVQNCPGFEHAVVGLEQLVGVIGQEGNTVTLFDAEVAQGVRQPVRPLGKLAVGELLVAVNHADLVAEIQLGAVTELEDGERDEHGRPPV